MMLFWLKEIFLFFKRSYKFAIFFGSVLTFLYFFSVSWPIASFL
jgi:hypothetical protein